MKKNKIELLNTFERINRNFEKLMISINDVKTEKTIEEYEVHEDMKCIHKIYSKYIYIYDSLNKNIVEENDEYFNDIDNILDEVKK